MRRIAVYTHSRPSNTEEAIIAAATRRRGRRLRAGRRRARPRRAAVRGAASSTASSSSTSSRPTSTSASRSAATGRSCGPCAATRPSTSPSSGSTTAPSAFSPRPRPPSSRPGSRGRSRGEFETVSLPGLDVEVGGARHIAVNDVSFTRRPHQRVAELSYSVGGREVGRVRCDGLVAATPAGSTGYNLANNGPILAWGVEGYVVSFIAPHTLTARALVVAPGDLLHVANVGERDSRRRRRRRHRGRPASIPARRSSSASATASRCSPSSRATPSTSGSARSSAAWPTERLPSESVLQIAGSVGRRLLSHRRCSASCESRTCC